MNREFEVGDILKYRDYSTLVVVTKKRWRHESPERVRMIYNETKYYPYAIGEEFQITYASQWTLVS